MSIDLLRNDLDSLSEHSNILAAGTDGMPIEWREKLHRHNYYEVQFLLRGESVYFNDFERYALSAGSMAFVSPGQLHTWMGDYDTFSVDVIAFRPETLTPTIQQLMLQLPFDDTSIAPLLTIPCTSFKLLETLFLTAKQRFFERPPNWQQVIASYLQTILSEIIYFKSNPIRLSNQTLSAAKTLTKAFRQAVENRFHQRIKIHAYADQLGVTTNHLVETVRETTGQTPKQIAQTRLLLEAKRLLVHTELSAQAIGATLAFPNSSAFGRWFKHMTASTPQQFRTQFNLP